MKITPTGQADTRAAIVVRDGVEIRIPYAELGDAIDQLNDAWLALEGRVVRRIPIRTALEMPAVFAVRGE